MDCAGCGKANRDGARFCDGCGKPLAPRCPACSTECRADAQFCDGCGAALASSDKSKAQSQPLTPNPVTPNPLSEARKVVTIIFADLIGSTSLHERLDAESTRRLMDRYYRALRGAVETHGGTVVKLLGDGVIAAFGVPRVAEDDALRAVRAAVAMQQVFRTLAAEQAAAVGELGLRVGVNTGEVVVSAGNDDVVGDPVNVAARLQQEAHDGEVLIGESTRRLVSELVTLAPAGVLSLKGRAETVAAHRVVSLERPAGAAATAFVGRDDELRRVLAVYDAAVTTPAARLAVILGSPGLGKSRLLDEVARQLGDGATVLTAHCESAGGATFAPLAKAVRELLGVGRTERTGPSDPSSDDALRSTIAAALPETTEHARIADGIAALLAGTPGSPEETFFVVRRFLAALATTRPVVLAIDDLQWAEPLLLDLVEHLVQWGKEARLLVLAAARPELRDTRSSLTMSGGLVADVVTLAGLDAGAATQLAANVIGADALPAAVAGRVLAASEGNPLFVGELVRMLVNDGALKREGDRWTAAVDLAAHDMPPTIHALLAARIERLRPEDRTVLERAAVVGRQFSRAAVAHLLPREITDLDARLESLRRSELLEPDASWFLGEPALRFHHGLTRDAAYRRVLKGTRAELHARLAEWIEAKVGESIEHDETLGWHFEQAHQHLRELGPIDAPGRAFGARAARYLGAAGRRALARDDLPVAANLLGRALDRLDASDLARADLALDWCEALLSAGDVGPAAKAIAELARFIDRPTPDPNPQPLASNPHLSAWHTCFTGQLAVLTDPQALRATADAVAAAADEFAAAGDAAGEAKAHSVHALALQRLGKVGACEAALDKALAAARRADDRRRSNAVLAGAPLAALWGPSPVTRASGRCLDVVRVLRITQGAPAVEAVALRCQAVLEALRGRTEAARRMIASSRRMVEELGITQGLLEAEMFAGLIELIEGDAVVAERSLRTAYEGLRTHGLGIDAARAAALLGRALFAQGQVAEAEALSHESEALAGDDLQAAIAWRRVRAETLAASGEHTAAVHVARAAVDIAGATDALLLHADARLALAVALRAAGRRDEADAEEARAIELWETKGASLLAERVRREGLSFRSPLPLGEGEGRRDETPRLDRPHPTPLPSGEGPERKRRIQANAATANAAHMDAAVAARDIDAFVALLAADAENVHHPTGTAFREGDALDGYRGLLTTENLTFVHEPLATLGNSLALCRGNVSFSALGSFSTLAEDIPFGAVESENIILIEVDAHGRRSLSEFFAIERLADAVVRLYERYAELLPEGPARTRAVVTARSIAALLAPLDLDRFATAFAPDIEFVDHRTLGLPSGQGLEGMLHSFGVLLELATDIAVHVDELLRLQPDGILMSFRTTGTDRVSGGAYEREFLVFWIFGAAGRVTYIEHFDSDRGGEALAGFDALTGAPKVVTRRVRPNAATANAARLDAAIAARDAGALPALLADGSEIVHHPTGAVYGGRGALSNWRALFRAKDVRFANEPLATLGDSLALCRTTVSFSALGEGDIAPFGAVSKDEIILIEADARGQRTRAEFFAGDRLGDAVARLYERYADLLPDGPARKRAAATARSVATILGPPDVDRFAPMIAPGIELFDHRRVGMGTGHGAEAFLNGLRALLEIADDVTARIDNVLGLRSNVFLVRRISSGTERVGGGAFERHLLVLCTFGTDGLVTRNEQFDVDRIAEALARFDELTGNVEERPMNPSVAPLGKGRTKEGSPTLTNRRVRPNAATANAVRLDAAVSARNADALSALYAELVETVHHPTGVTYDRQGALASLRILLHADEVRLASDPLATLGELFALCRQSLSHSAIDSDDFAPFGPVEREHIALIEVDAHGQRTRSEFFTVDHLSDAVSRLYERYAETLPEGPACTRAAATARSVAALVGPPDLDRYASALAPAVEFVDNRTVGFASGRGADKLLRGFRSLLEMAIDVATRVDDILRLEPDALLARWTTSGTDRVSGGAFESHFLLLWLFGTDGLVVHDETFDAERVDDALARFDALTGSARSLPLAKGGQEGFGFGSSGQIPLNPPLSKGDRTAVSPTPRIENAATQVGNRLVDALNARDWERFVALLPPGFRNIDRQRIVQLDVDRDRFLETLRPMFETLSSSTFTNEVLATRGNRLMLARVLWEGSGDSVGWSEFEWLDIIELDDNSDLIAEVTFDPDALDAAYDELDERYAAGAGARYGFAPARPIFDCVARRDWAALATLLSPALEVHDHRPLGWETLRGPAAFIDSLKALAELAPDVRMWVDHVIESAHRALNVGTLRGTREGGVFEDTRVAVSDHDEQRRVRRLDFYTVEQLDEAWARFEEISAGAIDNLGSTLRDGPEKMGPPQGEWKLSSRDNNRTVRPEEPPSSGGVSKGVLATPSLAGPDLLRIPPNAATRTVDRHGQALAARDMEALARLCTPTMVFDDRRRGVLLTGGGDMFIASSRIIASARVARTLLATAGDRLALEHLRWSGEAAGQEWEVENLSLQEVDADGLSIAIIAFDPGDRRAASVEMLDRDPRCDAVQRAMGDHDLDRLRAALPADFVFDDHRRTGLGRLGRDDYVASLAVLFEQTPDVIIETLYTIAAEEHRNLSMGHMFGTLANGGEFESVAVRLASFSDDGVVTVELFEPEDLDVARARFEELGGIVAKNPSVSPLGKGRTEEGSTDPLRIPPNAATRANVRSFEFIATRDWSAFRALTSADFIFDDRRKRSLVSGDVELFIKNLEVVISWQVSRRTLELLATVGDRLALDRIAFAGDHDGGTFEGEFLRLTEIDADGRLRAVIHFDLDDGRVAFAEAQARFVAGEAALVGGQVPIAALIRALGRQDWEVLSNVLAPDAAICDRRGLAIMGEVSGEQWVESLRTLAELAPDMDWELVRILAWNRHGRVGVGRLFGTTRDGGPFENAFVAVLLSSGDHVQRYEFFDIGDIDQALARFAELCAELRE